MPFVLPKHDARVPLVDQGRRGVRVAVVLQELEAPTEVVEIYGQAADLLRQPGPGRRRGDAQDVDAAGALAAAGAPPRNVDWQQPAVASAASAFAARADGLQVLASARLAIGCRQRIR